MHDQTEPAETMRRPRLLIRAARAGLPHYDRVRHLPRLLRRLGGDPGSDAQPALTRLLAAEARMEALRRAGGAGYRAAPHVEVMIALLAELGPRPAPAAVPPQLKASGSAALRVAI